MPFSSLNPAIEFYILAFMSASKTCFDKHTVMNIAFAGMTPKE